MEYIFLIIAFVALILLVVALINPAKALFWKKPQEVTKKKAVLFYTYITLFSFIAMVIALPKDPEAEKTTEQTEATQTAANTSTPSTPSATPASAPWKDYVTFDIPLSGSDYAFQVTIASLQTEIVKNAFSVRKEQYGPLEKEDGVEISFAFGVTNPYDKSLSFPLDDYFYLGHPDDNSFMKNTQRYSGCYCDANHYSDVYFAGGEKVEKKNYDRGCSNGLYDCIPFGPNETRTFFVRFKDPVRASIKNLWLHGLGRHVAVSKKRNEDTGWFLDLDKKLFSPETKIRD